MHSHHDYIPGTRVQVCIARPGHRARWVAGTFIGTTVGCTRHGSPFLVVETRDGAVWPTCAPEYVRAA